MNTNLTLIGYTRVSRVGDRGGDSFISPEVQREKIAGYAAAHGHTISEWITGLCAGSEFRLIEKLGYEIHRMLRERLPREARIEVRVTKERPPIENLDGVLEAIERGHNVDPLHPVLQCQKRLPGDLDPHGNAISPGRLHPLQH